MWGVNIEDYWSEEPNYTRERGITWKRLDELVELSTKVKRQAIYDMGVAVNAAQSEKPREALNRILEPPRYLSSEDLPPHLAMLKPVYKKKEASP